MFSSSGQRQSKPSCNEPYLFKVQIYARSILASVIRIDEQNVFSFESSQITSTHSTNTKEPELNFDLSTSDLTPKQKSVLLDFLHKHKDSFATTLSDICRTDRYKHRIDTVPVSDWDWPASAGTFTKRHHRSFKFRVTLTCPPCEKANWWISFCCGLSET